MAMRINRYECFKSQEARWIFDTTGNWQVVLGFTGNGPVVIGTWHFAVGSLANGLGLVVPPPLFTRGEEGEVQAGPPRLSRAPHGPRRNLLTGKYYYFPDPHVPQGIPDAQGVCPYEVAILNMREMVNLEKPRLPLIRNYRGGSLSESVNLKKYGMGFSGNLFSKCGN